MKAVPFALCTVWVLVACTPSPERVLEAKMDSLYKEGQRAEVLDSIAAVVLEAGAPADPDGYDTALRQWRSLREAYASVAAENPSNQEARDRLKVVDRRIALLNAERDYKSLIEVRYVSRAVNTHSGVPAGFISGEVKNLGPEIIEQLELRIDLLDASGRPVAPEQRTLPVLYLPGKTGSTEPLAPNHTRPFRLAVDREDAPSDWVSCRARVVMVELSRVGAEWPPRGQGAARGRTG